MERTLDRRKVLVTREAGQAGEFSSKIRENGGIAIEVPLLCISCLETEENSRLIARADDFDWLFFTSANGVSCFFELASKCSVNLDHVRMATVGMKTEQRLKQYGHVSDFIPSSFNAEIMAAEFLERYENPGNILLVRGNLSRNVLPEQLAERGITYSSAVVYQTEFNYGMKPMLNEVLENDMPDFITFTSPSTVEAFTEMAEAPIECLCVCIGTTTEQRAMELGFTEIITPVEFTVEAMLEKMLDYIQNERKDNHD